METTNNTADTIKKNADKLADFIMFSQRSVLLDLSRNLHRGNVSYAQFFLLGYLTSENSLTMTDIAHKMGHTTAAATGLVDRLEKMKYVKRFHAQDDRRKVLVGITEKGKELVVKMRGDIREGLVDLIADLDDKDDSEAVLDQFQRLAMQNIEQAATAA